MYKNNFTDRFETGLKHKRYLYLDRASRPVAGPDAEADNRDLNEAPEQTDSLKGIELREKHLKNLEELLKTQGVKPSTVHQIFYEMYEKYVKRNGPHSDIIGGPKDKFKMVISCIPTQSYNTQMEKEENGKGEEKEPHVASEKNTE